MNAQLRKKAKNDFEKQFFKLTNNSVVGKAIGENKSYKTCNLIKKKKPFGVRNKLSHNNFFSENLAVKIKKIQILMNIPIK